MRGTARRAGRSGSRGTWWNGATRSSGPLAEQRLSLLEDGRYGYRTKRGPTLILTGAELVKRLVALVPARSRHLTSFHGVFAPRARLRPSLIPCRGAGAVRARAEH